MSKIPASKLDNLNKDLIDSISSLEQIKAKHAIRLQPYLFEGLQSLQKIFTQALLDTLNENSQGLMPDEIAHARLNNKVEAIKLIRRRLPHCPVTEAKERVVRWQTENKVNPCGGQQ